MPKSSSKGRRSFWRDNGLSLALLALFLVFMAGLALTGWDEFNGNQREHGRGPVSLARYLATPEFGEAVFENWESEFLQMGLYVVLTVFLFQRGSAESKGPDAREPRVSRRRGWRSAIYRCSLSLAFLGLFLASFAGHALCGWGMASDESVEHGGRALSFADYFFGARFWFESFQNWQSEFLAVLAIVVLSIWLRQEGSPESKPLDALHGQTGG